MIYLFTDKSTERLLYIMEVIFKTILKTPYTFIDLSKNNELNYGSNDALLNYSSRNISGSFRLPVSGLLFEEDIRNQQPVISKDKYSKLFQANEDSCDLDFDVFAASFYLITEYEKYQRPIYDKHGRYKEDEYFTFKNDLYKEPLVNLYAEELWDKLINKFKNLKREQSKFDYEITIDVDHPWAFLHKGFIGYVGFLKDILKLNVNNFSTRYQSLKTLKDPFDCFDWLYSVCPKQKTKFFFLINNQSKFDGKHTAHNPHYQELIRKTAEQGFECGIHTSYSTFLSASAITAEKNMLAEILGREVYTSRQHYLKYRLPQTYKALNEAGIMHDYTTGLINGIGFRNGIANEFNWFDLERNEKTNLILHPSMAMDVSLKNYLGYNSEYAFNMLLDLIEKTRKVGGKFVLIWHNSNLSQIDGWTDWKGTFSELLKYLDSKVK